MGQIGSSTSGRGLSVVQVAETIKYLALTNSRREHRSASDGCIQENDSIGEQVRRKLEAAQKGCTKDDKNIFIESVKHEVTVENTVVRVTEYAPEAFSLIKAMSGIDDEHFADEWSLPMNCLKMELGEGRSQALFLKSKNQAFIAKTISLEEVKVLLRILESYIRHIMQNPSSFLVRFYILFKMEVSKNVGYILCVGDVFAHAMILNEKWDIKGRAPKPGKFLYFPHLLRHAYEPDPYIIDTPHEEEEVSTDSKVIKIKAQDRYKLATHHDKDLTRFFWLEKDTREKLLTQLLADYCYLGLAGLMDYSLLIGVSYNEGKKSRSGKLYVVIRNMKPPQKLNHWENDFVEMRSLSHSADNMSLSSSHQSHLPRLEFMKGIHSLLDQEVYYIGIIDMLTTYTIKKKLANFFKSFLWKDNTLSTIPVDKYRWRISKYTKFIFPEVT